jgi:hypothetical protein
MILFLILLVLEFVIAVQLKQQLCSIISNDLIYFIFFTIFVMFLICSEFGDIFDLEHFKKILSNDVRVVSALPSTHIMTRPVEGRPPLHATPSWIRTRYLKRVRIVQCFLYLSICSWLKLIFKL